MLDDLQTEFLLRATQAHAGAKQLHAPKVMVLNGETATMQVFTDWPYIDTDGTEKNASHGVMLDILPTVQENEKEVLLKGNICFSDILENDPQTPDDIPYMQVGSIPIHAVVKNTGTLLITGPELRSYKETVTNPGLRKIPVVGRHLSNVSIVDERYRLLILIKPTGNVRSSSMSDGIPDMGGVLIQAEEAD
jgi:type II secretory pathway component GspD/PulD (secretin)